MKISIVYKCQNRLCLHKTTDPRIVHGKPFCPLCNYETEPVKPKADNPFKGKFEGKEELQTTNNDRLDRMAQAVIEGGLFNYTQPNGGNMAIVADIIVTFSRDILKEIDKNE